MPVHAGYTRHADEGLVAEIGAAVLLAEFGLATSALGPDRNEVCEAWTATVARVRDDEGAVFRAARDATGAVEWLRRKATRYLRFADAASTPGSRPDTPVEISATREANQVIAAPGSSIPGRMTDELGPLLAAQRARRVTGEALGFRHRPVPAGDDDGAWRAKAAALTRDVASLDLTCLSVRAAVEAEVAVAASRRAEIVSAEMFVADFRDVTQRRLAMADPTARHTRAMTIGEVSLGL